MSEGERRNQSPRGLFNLLFRTSLPLETETSVFILMSTLDFFLTYWGLWNGTLRESNPIARWFLEGWGVTKGLMIYKLSLVTLVCLIAQIVATQKLETARRLLIFSSLVTFAVVIYIVRLLAIHEGLV